MKNVFRFSPSPTGTLHMGSARTALFSYLLARNCGGKFILRIEDTDRVRSTKEFETNIIEGLKWLGITWDEFYRQSEHIGVHLQYAEHLIDLGWAYREDGCIKFKVKPETVTFTDLIRGEIKFDLTLQDDFVLIKSDGSASYQFAVVCDDHDEGITHVIRGEDHIPNTPKQIQIYQAFGWELPKYGHLSIILGMDRTKLSKRNGAKSIDQFQQAGYLPKAVFNYLALLGWSAPNGSEILTKDELVKCYTIDRVSKSNSIFDPTKLEWYNRQYIQRLSPDGLAEFLPDGNVKLAELIQSRLSTLCDIPKLIQFLTEPKYDRRASSWWKDFIVYFRERISWNQTVINYKTVIDDYITTRALPKNDVYTDVRYGVTGMTDGLPLFQVLEHLGPSEVIRRVHMWY